MTNRPMDLPEESRPRLTTASYDEPDLPAYQNNPLIAALGKQFMEKELYRNIAQYPDFDPNVRAKEPHIRAEALGPLGLFFQPLSRHWSLYQNLTTMIRRSYLNRNPFAANYEHEIKVRAGRMAAPTPEPVCSLRSGLLTGISGLGKTFSLKRILSFIPQVIEHTEYQGKAFPYKQLAWLKLECPADASPRAFCLSFFQKVDWLLGTKYLSAYNGDHMGAGIMVPAVGRVALLHSLGLLVIDEVQNLSMVKAGGANKLLNFVVQVVNTLEVPVLLVGNSNALNFLTSAMRLARRSTGLLHPHWMRLSEGTKEWEIFLDRLWAYQYLKTETKLDDNLRRVFYAETQGIPDCAVKLYEGVQQELINEGGDERITPEVIERVAHHALTANHVMISALRDHDYRILRKLQDVHPIDVFGPSSREALEGWPVEACKPVRSRKPQQPAAKREKKPPIRISGDEDEGGNAKAA